MNVRTKQFLSLETLCFRVISNFALDQIAFYSVRFFQVNCDANLAAYPRRGAVFSPKNTEAYRQSVVNGIFPAQHCLKLCFIFSCAIGDSAIKFST